MGRLAAGAAECGGRRVRLLQQRRRRSRATRRCRAAAVSRNGRQCARGGHRMTRSDQKFIVGLAAGLAAAFAGARVARNRHLIDFGGRVVVISGGSRGLGLVMARRLAAEGARLVLLARDPDELDRARAQLPRRADVRTAMARVLERWRGVDVLINNAGVIQVGPLEHMTQEDFENAMATHFWGPLYLMFELVPSMRHRSFGR